MEIEHHIANLGELAYAQCACVLSAGKMPNRMYGDPREGAVDLCNGAVSEKKRYKLFDLRCPLSTWLRFCSEQKPRR